MKSADIWISLSDIEELADNVPMLRTRLIYNVDERVEQISAEGSGAASACAHTRNLDGREPALGKETPRLAYHPLVIRDAQSIMCTPITECEEGDRQLCDARPLSRRTVKKVRCKLTFEGWKTDGQITLTHQSSNVVDSGTICKISLIVFFEVKKSFALDHLQCA